MTIAPNLLLRESRRRPIFIRWPPLPHDGPAGLPRDASYRFLSGTLNIRGDCDGP